MHRKGLVIGILILLIGVNIGSTFAGDVDVKTMSPVGFDGNTLYVGGDGSGNYSKIQDAIDNASDGDTVFVYNGIYYEFVLVNKQITLRGEDKHNTIIEGSGTPYYAVIHVYPGDTLKNVTISDFTIRNTPKHSGISLNPDNNIVSNCIFYNLHSGIYIDSDNNIIFNCQCYNTFCGISINTGDNNEISYCQCYSNEYAGTSINNGNNNKISNCNIYSNIGIGIYMDHANSNTISKCNISKNEYGIRIAASGNNIINDCTILENVHGVRISNGYDNKVYHNNFIGNIRHAIFDLWRNILGNRWDSNYWDKWIGFGPKIIIGRIGLNGFIPWINFDWHPAEEPYDIEV